MYAFFESFVTGVMNLNVNHLGDLGVVELSFKIASKRPMINLKEWMSSKLPNESSMTLEVTIETFFVSFEIDCLNLKVNHKKSKLQFFLGNVQGTF